VATSAIYCRVMLLLDLTILLVKFTVQWKGKIVQIFLYQPSNREWRNNYSYDYELMLTFPTGMFCVYISWMYLPS
jgi:hypothetical protein